MKVWKFGDDINTDIITPGRYTVTTDKNQLGKIAFIEYRPEFRKNVKDGDVIVAGQNFGCGSSRESAPANLKRMGISCVVAESFARIFFRNCMAIAFPVTICKGVSDVFEEGDLLELDFENSLVKNMNRGKALRGVPLHPELLKIIKSGGILESFSIEIRLRSPPGRPTWPYEDSPRKGDGSSPPPQRAP